MTPEARLKARLNALRKYAEMLESRCKQQAQEIERLTALVRELAIQVGERDELINRLRLQLEKCEAGR